MILSIPKLKSSELGNLEIIHQSTFKTVQLILPNPRFWDPAKIFLEGSGSQSWCLDIFVCLKFLFVFAKQFQTLNLSF